MMIRTLVTTFLLALVGAVAARSQGVATSESFTIGARDTAIFLAHEFVVPGTIQLTLDSVAMLGAAGEFTLDARYGVLRLGPALRALIADTSRRHTVTISYRYRPIPLDREYARRRLVTLVDSTGKERQVAEPRSELTAASIFGRNFQRSGSVVRGFTVGSNRDLTLQSGLRIQFSGNITDDVEVLGALTDEQTPIQPEGNTQTLREIDNIFIEIRSPYAGATFGKFIAASPVGGYTAYSRKLQGVKAVARYGGFGTTEVVAAVAPGRFRTQQLQGRERDQGPYRLTGQNGERGIVVVAGTERVFVDGIEMVRGESNDYVIDYGTAEIFFQTRRPITSLSRITVDFEYTDRQFSRSFVAINNTGYLFDSMLAFSASYVREADNPDATIDISLNEADRALLTSAGADRRRAVRSGATFVGRNDTASGTYVRIDTTINGVPDSVFRYAPADPAAVYNVIFSIPPEGIGDYRYVAFGQYEYAGKGLGSYLPVVFLPMPELRQVGSISFRARPAEGIAINGEFAFSDASVNRFSADPSSQYRGAAFTAAANVLRDSLFIGGANIGAVRFGARAQYVGARFQTVERLGEVEFNNRWNVRFRPGEGIANFILEDSLIYTPFRRLQLFASNGYLRQGGGAGGAFTSLRQEYSTRFLGDSALPSADYTFELISTDTLGGARKGRWWKQRGGLSQIFGVLVPGARFEWEHREDRAGQGFTDTLYASSFRYFEAGPELRVNLPFMTTTAIARYRLEDSVRYDSAQGTLRFMSDGTSQTYTLRNELRGVRDLNSTLDFTYRRKRYDSVPGVPFAERLDNSTILARWQTRWAGFDRGVDLDGLYEVQTEQAARLQRLFLRVPFGQGEYIWIDLDSNGLQTEEEFRLALPGEGEYIRFDLPTEQLYPIIDLRASARFKLQPKQLIDVSTPLGRLLAPITTETTLRVEEKSQSERESNVYLLRFGTFQNDSTTLVGTSLIQQDVNLFEANPEYSFRLRYLGRSGLTRLVSTIERTGNIERSLRIRWQPTFDIGLQLDLASNHGMLRSTDTLSRRTFDLTALTAANDFSYRPEQSLELGWLLRLASSRDVLPITPRTTLLNTNALRAIYSIETRGRIRLEVERTNVSGTNLGGDVFSIPYQLTDGYAIGNNWIGRASFEYRFGANIQASITYTGRAQPPSMRVIHIGQAEVRAFF
jgi:hypothetical protein